MTAAADAPPRRHWPVALRVGVVLLAIHLVLAALGLRIAPYAQDQMMVGRPFAGPSLEHPFGTDQPGRDIFSRGWPEVGS